MFEEEYKKIIEQLKENEDYAVMRVICENIVDLLEENGIKPQGTIYKKGGFVVNDNTLSDSGAVCFFGLDFTEHDRILESKFKQIINEQKKQISELESELETAEYAFNHIRDCSKSQFDKNEKQEKEIKHWRDEAQKQSWRVSELNRALCIKGDLLEKANERIAELESELAVKENLLKIKNGLCGEEPLPFTCDEYTDALFEELEDLRDRHQQDCITINQLHTTIDTLVDRYAKLRKAKGL